MADQQKADDAIDFTKIENFERINPKKLNRKNREAYYSEAWDRVVQRHDIHVQRYLEVIEAKRMNHNYSMVYQMLSAECNQLAQDHFLNINKEE